MVFFLSWGGVIFYVSSIAYCSHKIKILLLSASHSVTLMIELLFYHPAI